MDQFREKGWNLTEEGFKKISENGTINHFPTLLKTALNTDLREIGASAFPTDSKSKFEVPKAGMVLQLVKIIRNIAAPKANQDSKFAPRLLKIQFTDGQNQFSGIEVEHISPLSLNDTKPGTKLFFRPGKVITISQDLLLLRPNYFDVLGGHVQDLVEKWEVAQKYSKFSTTIRALTQAPPWIAFGQKIDRKSIDVNKKSLSSGDKKNGEDGNKEDDAFDNQRKEAIAEAQKMNAKKVFLDGAKKIVHHNVQKIVDKGFTEEEAKEALRYSRNDLGKALANLKRSANGGGGDSDDGRYHHSSRGGGRGGRGGGRRGGGRGGGRFGGNDDSEEFMAKPSEKISLFDFIGDQLPAEVKNAKPIAVAPIPQSSSAPGNTHHRSQGYSDNRSSGNKFSSDSNRGHPRNNNRQSEFSRPPYHQQQQPPQFSNPRGPPPGGNQRAPNPRHERSYQNNNPRAANQSHPHVDNRTGGGGAGANLARDMERMHLSNRPQTASGNNSHHHQQKSGNSNNNGFPNYDPRRTMGFLNKESNEAAKKFLQQKDPPLPHHQPQQQQQQPHHNQYQSQQQPHLSQPGPQFQQNHRPMRSAPPSRYSGAVESKSTWNWKIGDRCLAKYWEDGKYYNAEITAVAGATCVVSFMEYGNFEEVLKDDCLPITAD